MKATQALDRLLSDYPDVVTVLDIGSGDGEHAKAMRARGKYVTTVSLKEPADYVGAYPDACGSFRGVPFDAVWASHVLEHQANVGRFLSACFHDLREGGVLAVTVPPLKHQIVGGHLTLWNGGLLLYNLIVAGFDCREARVSSAYGYNLSVIVRKRQADLPALNCDCGDIEKLRSFFPFRAEHGFDGRLESVNW
jgi:SAM-dependent methyltransferase